MSTKFGGKHGHGGIRRRKFCFALLAAACVGCSATLRGPNLGTLYERPAQQHDELRNPVIVIPGILGSKLRDDDSGRVVWGAFAGNYANPETPEGARLVALPMQEGVLLHELTDQVVPDGVLDRVKVSLVGLPVELNAYFNILATLGVGGYRDELLGKVGAVDYGPAHFTCFQFDYDWRRDLVENAARLDAFIEDRRTYIQAELGRRYGAHDHEVKFDIVAHSMGGLLARYYLLYGSAELPSDGTLPPATWAGAERVDRVITVGTPHAGSVKALVQLVKGATLAPIVPTYPPAVIGTMPTLYQLMPRTRHRAAVWASDRSGPARQGLLEIDLYDVEVWKQMGWGLADPRQDKVLKMLLPEQSDPNTRRRIALEHLEKCLSRAEQFHRSIDVDASAPPGLEMFLFAGDSIATDSVVHIDPRNGRIVETSTDPGDGTVLRTSALMDERVGNAWTPGLPTPIPWKGVTFLFADHIGLTKNPMFSDNVLFLLLEQRRRSTAPPHS